MTKGGVAWPPWRSGGGHTPTLAGICGRTNMSEKAHTSRVRHHIVLAVIVLTVVGGRAATRPAEENEAEGHKRRTTWHQRRDRHLLSPLAVGAHDTETVTFTVLAVLYNEFFCAVSGRRLAYINIPYMDTRRSSRRRPARRPRCPPRPTRRPTSHLVLAACCCLATV